MIFETIKRQTQVELVQEIELYFTKYPSQEYGTKILDVNYVDEDEVWVAFIGKND